MWQQRKAELRPTPSLFHTHLPPHVASPLSPRLSGHLTHFATIGPSRQEFTGVLCCKTECFRNSTKDHVSLHLEVSSSGDEPKFPTIELHVGVPTIIGNARMRVCVCVCFITIPQKVMNRFHSNFAGLFVRSNPRLSSLLE